MLQVRGKPRHRHVGPAIQHQPHRAFRAVVRQQDDRLGEVRIGQATRGHEELAGRESFTAPDRNWPPAAAGADVAASRLDQAERRQVPRTPGRA